MSQIQSIFIIAAFALALIMIDTPAQAQWEHSGCQVFDKSSIDPGWTDALECTNTIGVTFRGSTPGRGKLNYNLRVALDGANLGERQVAFIFRDEGTCLPRLEQVTSDPSVPMTYSMTFDQQDTVRGICSGLRLADYSSGNFSLATGHDVGCFIDGKETIGRLESMMAKQSTALLAIEGNGCSWQADVDLSGFSQALKLMNSQADELLRSLQ